jgi:putative spermidine/putrescine transport system permease protein
MSSPRDRRVTSPAHDARRAVPRRVGTNSWALLAVPGIVVLAVFFLLPLGLMVIRSLTDPSPANYLVFTTSDIYVRVLVNTLLVSVICTLVCLVLGYPYAYAMHRAGPSLSIILTVAVVLPFWSSALVRSYAWLVLLRESGVINTLLLDAGVISTPFKVVRTETAVIIGMCHILLPFMVFPIYAAMRRIDPSLMPAATGLGAHPFRAMRKVFVPLSLPGVYAGSLIVFVVALGFYVVPALLGGPRSLMFSELIVGKVYEELQFGVGAAMAITLVVTTLVSLALVSRFVKVGDALEYGTR